jgi:S-adenosylmethionine/arginine decarboxylase-like enzyme
MQHGKSKAQEKYYGQELILNLYGCSLAKISSGAEIRRFIRELCRDVIKMKRYGRPLVPHFGHNDPITSGYSLVQLIETSSVTGHFSEKKHSAYLNIFSCAWFDAKKTTAFCKRFFGAKRATAKLIPRP